MCTNAMKSTALRLVLAVSLLGVLFIHSAQATPGALDTSFGSGGKVMAEIGAPAYANALVRQPDDKLVAAGYAVNNVTGNDFALARYNRDGSLDTTFGTGGKVMTMFGFSDDVANAVAVRPDGKIVAAGYTDSGPLQPRRVARHDLQRNGQGHHAGRAERRLRQRSRTAAGREDRRRRLRGRAPRQQVRARPLQPGRVARHELQRNGQGQHTGRLGFLRLRARAAARREARRRRLRLGRLAVPLRARTLQAGRLARCRLRLGRHRRDRDRPGLPRGPRPCPAARREARRRGLGL